MTAQGTVSSGSGSYSPPIPQSDVTGLVAALLAKAAAVHSHAESDVTSLLTDLSGKASSVHTHAESDVTSLATDLAAKVPATRSMAAGTGLTGGGDLSADRSYAVAYGTVAGTATQGNDGRVTGAVQNTRQVLAGTGATGGGALSADVTVGVAYDTAKPYSGISLGTVGVANKAARSDHRHPGGGWSATDHGLIAWNFPNFIGGASQVLSAAGTLTVWKVPVDEAALAAAGGVITNVVLAVGAVGVSLTSGQNFAGLWLADGTLVGITADQSAAWVSAGSKVMPLAGGPYAPTGGAQEVYVGAWYNGSTSPGFVRAGSAPSGLANVGLSSSAAYKYATANTGLTTAGANLGTRTASNNMVWAAVS